MDDSRPIFAQISLAIEEQIIAGALPEETQVPSTNELAMFYRINPATAAKGINQLVERNVLYKRRGIGMFVQPGARSRLLADRRATFRDTYVQPLVAEARALGLSSDEVTDLITEEFATDTFPVLIREQS